MKSTKTKSVRLPSGIEVELRQRTGQDFLVVARAVAATEDRRPEMLAEVRGLASLACALERLGEKRAPIGWSEMLALSAADISALSAVQVRLDSAGAEYAAYLQAEMGPGSEARQAILDALALARLQVLPFPEALALPTDERRALVGVIARALGTEQELKGSRVEELKGSRVEELKGSRAEEVKGSRVEESEGSEG